MISQVRKRPAHEIIVACPHCHLAILIMSNEINCAIFRHGVFKSTGKQVNPHLPKEQCDYLYKTGKIVGCGKPFRLIHNDGANYQTVPCDYI